MRSSGNTGICLRRNSAGLLVKSAAGDQRPDGVACFRRDQLPFCHRIKAVRSKDRAEAADFPGIVQTGVPQKVFRDMFQAVRQHDCFGNALKV